MSPCLRPLPAHEYRRERWRNGHGWTREVLRMPEAAEDWDWRLSIAEIERDAPFSAFPGVERELVLRVTGHARDPTDGYAVADDLLCVAHRALLADPTLGGLTLAVDEQETDYQAEDADVDAVAIPATYRITYRTLVSDISQGG